MRDTDELATKRAVSNRFIALERTLNVARDRETANAGIEAKAVVLAKLVGNALATQHKTLRLRECRARLDDVEDELEVLAALSASDKAELLDQLIVETEQSAEAYERSLHARKAVLDTIPVSEDPTPQRTFNLKLKIARSERRCKQRRAEVQALRLERDALRLEQPPAYDDSGSTLS